MKSKSNCFHCADTGILKAGITTNEEGRVISVVVCGGFHFSNETAEKNILAMHEATGLDVDILGVDKPVEKQDRK
jgi:hypothetical protein